LITAGRRQGHALRAGCRTQSPNGR
jgi:hypothetical protein